MTSRRSAPAQATRGPEYREALSRLVTALQGADLDEAATLVARDDDTASRVEALDHARRVLLSRLTYRSSDFRATAALKALDTFTAELRADEPSGAPARLRRQGERGTVTARHWLHLGGAA
jgi:hypothetical protein